MNSNINYRFEKPISEITEDDKSFSIGFSEDTFITHTDSVSVPRNPDNSVNIYELELAISKLIDYVSNKFSSRFIKF